MSKLEYAQRAAAALAYLVLHQQDSVGLVTFDSEIRSLVRASSNPSHLKEHSARHGSGSRPSERPSIGPIFHDLAERLKKRGIVIVLSDLFDDVDAMMAGLKHLRHRRHEVIVMHVLDPAEVDFPFDRTDAVPRPGAIARRAGRAARPAARPIWPSSAAISARLQAGCRAQAIDYVPLRTDQSLEVVLSSYLASRGRVRVVDERSPGHSSGRVYANDAE